MDFIPQDNINNNFQDCPVPHTYCPDTPLDRKQLDKKSNLHGSLITVTSICKNHQLRILNGRFLGDSLGYFTFFNQSSQSTVDYMLSLNKLFYDIKYFQLHPPNENSDHCPVSVVIKTYKPDATQQMHEGINFPGRYMLSDENASTFKDMLLHDSIRQEILNLNYRLDNMNDTDVNSHVNDLNDIDIRVANSSLTFKRNNNKRKKVKPKKVWLSYDCLRFRREVRSLG